MKKIILILLFSITFVHLAIAQTDFFYPELLSKDSIVTLCAYNKQLIMLKKDRNKKFILSVNDKKDTLKIDFPVENCRIIPAHYNTGNNIYIQSFYYNKLTPITNMYKLNLNTKISTKILEENEYQNIYCIIKNYCILGKNMDSNIYEYNMETMKIDTLFDGGESFFMTTNVLIEYQALIGYYESGSIENFALYNFNNKQMIYPIELLDTLSYFKKGKVDVYYRDVTEEYYNIGLFWFDKKFNIIQPTLLQHTQTYATYNIGETQFCYRSSYIERNPLDNYVWVACKFSLTFDKALYDIYYNTLLEKTTIETFDKWELNKLRNMIFAKHGYQFQSEYLQAFFNLFDFYNNIKKTSDVNALLTPIDKKNLKLIQDAESKLIKK
jgi:hypothetical protein